MSCCEGRFGVLEEMLNTVRSDVVKTEAHTFTFGTTPIHLLGLRLTPHLDGPMGYRILVTAVKVRRKGLMVSSTSRNS